MNKKTKEWIIILGLCVALFYLLPLAGMLAAGSITMEFMVNLLLLINPLFSLVIAIVFSLRGGFNWLLPIVLGASFAPSVFLFYNETGAVYILIYVGLAYLGDLTGLIFQRSRK